MATTCVFCGASGKMTAEHVLPKWLGGLGLDSPPARRNSVRLVEPVA